jgi:hypothetical protein
VRLQLEQHVSLRDARSRRDVDRRDDALGAFRARLRQYDRRDDDPSSQKIRQ